MAELTPQQIYELFQTAHPEHIQSARDAANRLSEHFGNNADDTQVLINSLADGWQGQAQEAASQGLAPLAENAYQAGNELGDFHAAVDAQLDMFYSTAAKVTPMPTQPAISNPLPMIAIGAMPLSSLEQVSAYNSAAQQNVDAYQAYSSYINDSVAGMPPLAADLDTQSAPVQVNTTRLGESAKGGTPHHASAGTAPAPVRPADAGSRSTGTGPSGTVAGTAPVGSSPTGQGNGGAGTSPSSNSGSTGNTDPSSASGATVPASVGQPVVADSGARVGGAFGGAGIGGPVGGRGGVGGGLVGVGRPGLPGGDGVRVPLGSGGRGGAVEGGGAAAVSEEEVAAGRNGGGVVEEPVTTGLGGGARKREDRERESRFVQSEDRSVEFGVPESLPPAVLGESFDQDS